MAKRKLKTDVGKSERRRRTRPEAMLSKPTTILKDLKKQVNRKELDVAVQSIRETRSRDK